jgi:GNAT superfamily N-acetyltransferase
MDYDFRPATLDDLPAIHEVFLAALNDLNARTGRPAVHTPASDRAAIRGHVLKTDPGGYWVAVRRRDGRVQGWAGSIRRGWLWFLSGFWVHPAAQGHGLGRRLLALSGQTALPAAEGGITCVYASRDHRALGLYGRAGMFAEWPLFTWNGRPGPALAPGQATERLAAAGLRVAVVPPRQAFTPAQAAAVSTLDAGIRGAGADRLIDHAFFRAAGGFTTYLFTDAADSPVGAATLSDWGSIAPLLAATPAVQEPILAYLLAEAAARGLSIAGLDVPGVNRVLTAALLAHGFQLVHYNFFLTSQPFGHFDRYAISGAVLF